MERSKPCFEPASPASGLLTLLNDLKTRDPQLRAPENHLKY